MGHYNIYNNNLDNINDIFSVADNDNILQNKVQKRMLHNPRQKMPLPLLSRREKCDKVRNIQWLIPLELSISAFFAGAHILPVESGAQPRCMQMALPSTGVSAMSNFVMETFLWAENVAITIWTFIISIGWLFGCWNSMKNMK